jgi:hypothetical protein
LRQRDGQRVHVVHAFGRRRPADAVTSDRVAKSSTIVGNQYCRSYEIRGRDQCLVAGVSAISFDLWRTGSIGCSRAGRDYMDASPPGAAIASASGVTVIS